MTLDSIEQGAEATATGPHDARLDGLPVLITIARVADLLGISRSAAYRCAGSGELPTTHLGGRVYVVTARLRAQLEAS